MGKPFDSSRQTETIGTATLPPALRRLKAAPLTSADQEKASTHIALLIASPLFYLLASAIVGAGSSDYLVASPLPDGAGFIPAAIGLPMFLLVRRDMLVVQLRWIGLAGWIAVIAGSIVYAGLGLAGRANATAGPPLRAIPVDQKCGRGSFATCRIRFALQDGSNVTVSTRSAFDVGRRCYLTQRVGGRGGFEWLRLVDASPAPGRGRLAWPIDRTDCFSKADLSTLYR